MDERRTLRDWFDLDLRNPSSGEREIALYFYLGHGVAIATIVLSLLSGGFILVSFRLFKDKLKSYRNRLIFYLVRSGRWNPAMDSVMLFCCSLFELSNL